MEKQTLKSGVSGAERFLKWRHLIVLACLLVVGVLLLVHVVSANAVLLSATLRVEPNIQTVDVGEHFTVDVMINDYSDLGGYEFNLLSDSSVVRGENAEDGGLLASSDRTLVGPLLAIDNSNSTGKVAVGAVAYGDPAGPSGTDGKLATVQLKAIGLHNTALDLDGIQIVDTQGNLQPLLPPVGANVLVNTADNGKYKERCKPQRWARFNMDPGEDTDPPGLGTVDCRDDGQAKAGHYAFKITGSPAANKYLFQKKVISGGAGETFKLSGWSYVTSGAALGGKYRLVVVPKYTDDTEETLSVEFSHASGDWNTWQYREIVFTTAKAYKRFAVYARFAEMPETATAWFDDIQLVRQ